MKLLITCPPMILRINQCKHLLKDYDVLIPEFTQTLSEEELIEIIKDIDVWIAGDDPVTKNVLSYGKKLKTVIKWGIGTDNIDFEAIKELDLKFSNTPGMFGNEVADVAIGYLIGITRRLFLINNEVRKNNWVKPSGISLCGKKIGLIGFGDIGRNIASRLLSLKMNVFVSDPGFEKVDGIIKCKYSKNIQIDSNLNNICIVDLHTAIQNSDVVILSCPSTKETYHLINSDTINLMNDNSYIINVSRGALVNEIDVVDSLKSGKLSGFASDVFEKEPISMNNELLSFDNVIVGSHNASNTVDAVDKTNLRAIELLKMI